MRGDELKDSAVAKSTLFHLQIPVFCLKINEKNINNSYPQEQCGFGGSFRWCNESKSLCIVAQKLFTHGLDAILPCSSRNHLW